MKYCYLFLFFLSISSCEVNIRKTRVDKYLNNDSFTPSRKNKLVQQNFYDKSSNLITKIEYSTVGCNAVDSIEYFYNYKNQLIEENIYKATDVKENCKSVFTPGEKKQYSYDKDGKLKSSSSSDKDLDNSFIEQQKKYLTIYNPLQLLTEYLMTINFVCLDAKSKKSLSKGNSTKIEFVYERTPYILTDYGVPKDELLKSMIVHLKKDILVKDEFFFQNYTLTRTYYYQNNLIYKVLIENIRLADQVKGVSVERFVKNDVQP